MSTRRWALKSVCILVAALLVGVLVTVAVLPPSTPPQTLWLHDGDLRDGPAGARIEQFELAPFEYVGGAPPTETPAVLLRHSSGFAATVYGAVGRSTEWWFHYASESAQAQDGSEWRRYQFRD